MNDKIKLFLALGCIAGASAFSNAQTPLPRVKILGKSFYYYESKKGESLYGIAERFGWDPAVLEKTNRDVSTRLDDGTLLYYPAEAVANKTASASAEPAGSATLQQHAGAQASSSSPASPAESAAPQPSESSDGYIYHTVEANESLYGISRLYNTTVEDLFRVNPGLQYGNPEKGSVIRVLADTNDGEKHVETVEEQHVESLAAYKVRRGDSWEKIAQVNGVPVAALKDANPGITKLSKGSIIRIPQITTVSVQREYVAEDPREKNDEGIRELYNEVHDLQAEPVGTVSGAAPVTEVGVAVVLTDFGESSEEKRNKQNKEMEFSRGALTAVDALKGMPFRTRLTIIDGSQEQEAVKSKLDAFDPAIIVTTSDHSIPSYLVNYADSTSTVIVNSFDPRDENYVENPYVIQYLPPTSYVNSEVTEYVEDTFKDYKLIVAGTPDSSDSLGASIIKAFSEMGPDRVEEVEIQAIPDMELDGELGKYLVYGTPTSSKDVKSLLEKVNSLRSRYMMSEIRVLGRPNWVPYASSLKELYGDNYVYIPSRFYFDPDEPLTKEFIDHYESLFSLRPMKASPVYCATAYDIITYFVPNIASSGGDFNIDFTSYPTIQSPIDLRRVSNWGGIVNEGVYVISFAPFGTAERISLPRQ